MSDSGASVRPSLEQRRRLLLSTATFLWVLSAAAEALDVNVTNDGPAILDSTITFRAQLVGGEFPTLYYVFRHNVPSAAEPEMITNGTEAVLPMTFLAYRHPPGEYMMTVSVLKEYFFTKHKIAEGSCKFLLTRDIVGKIVASQDGHVLPDDQTIVSTNRTTNFTFALHDPSGYFTNSSNSLSWKLDYGLSHYAEYYTINFTDTSVHTVNLIVVALVTRPNATSPQVKLGSFSRNIAPKDPITGVSVQGNVWLRRGDVVSLQVSCNGSAPYNYCWKYLPGNATSNSTANLTCDEPISTNQCQFPLVHYFPQDGSHFIAILVSNIVQQKPYIKNIEVHIYDVSQQQQLSTIVVPIVCSVFALVIVALGLAYHMHTRNQLRIEVADFDFNEPRTDDLVEKTFADRLRSALLQALLGATDNDAEAESNMSPTASSIRHPVAASREELHLVRRSYGTIA
ncbi:transmembrane protein 130 isoform X2 [Dermacentor variabilis]|uniref:transmembrane protein 130 isoform X2 n=2 Tax=Dermacentor variabilis TaxID=34621 RepID=UPI003F5B7526